MKHEPLVLPPVELRRLRLPPPPHGFEWSDVPELSFSPKLTLLPHPDEPPVPKPPSTRECLDFAIPAIGANTAGPLMSIIDAAFVGRVSSLELAALGPAGSIADSASQLLAFAAIAATNLVARSHATGKAKESARSATVAIAVAVAGGVALAIVTLICAKSAAVLYCGAGSPLIAPTLEAIRIRVAAFPAATLSLVASAVCLGTKDSRTPLAAILLAAAINLCGDFVFVCMFGWGLRGAAWATSISQYCGALLLLRVLAKRHFLRPKIASRAERGEALRILRAIFGFIPFCYVMLLKIAVHNTAAATAASLGGADAAAHTALFSIAMLCFTIGDVGSMLCQAYLPAFVSESRVPVAVTKSRSFVRGPRAMAESVVTRLFGRRRSTKRSREEASQTTVQSFDLDAARPTVDKLIRTMLGISSFVVGVSVTIVICFSGQISKDREVVGVMLRTLPLMATALTMHGSAVTLEGLLLAQKDFPFLAASYTVIVATIICLQRYVRKTGLGLKGVWLSYVFFQASRVLLFSLRAFRARRSRARA